MHVLQTLSNKDYLPKQFDHPYKRLPKKLTTKLLKFCLNCFEAFPKEKTQHCGRCSVTLWDSSMSTNM